MTAPDMKPDSFHLAAGDGDEDFRQGRASSDAAPSAYTPGPWTARVVGTTTDHEGNERKVAEVYAAGHDLLVDATYAEDARLMAAAPELLEALIAYVQVDAGKAAWPGSPCEKARAAIAKALGTPDSASGSPASQGQSQMNKETP